MLVNGVSTIKLVPLKMSNIKPIAAVVTMHENHKPCKTIEISGSFGLLDNHGNHEKQLFGPWSFSKLLLPLYSARSTVASIE